MNMRTLTILIATAIAACAPTPSGAAPQTFNLEGSEWALETGEDVPFIHFSAEGKVTGNGGCNRFIGTYEQSGNQLSFGPIMSAKMACLNPNNETAFFDTLDQTQFFEGGHLKLVLKSETGEGLLTLNHRDAD